MEQLGLLLKWWHYDVAKDHIFPWFVCLAYLTLFSRNMEFAAIWTPSQGTAALFYRKKTQELLLQNNLLLIASSHILILHDPIIYRQLPPFTLIVHEQVQQLQINMHKHFYCGATPASSKALDCKIVAVVINYTFYLKDRNRGTSPQQPPPMAKHAANSCLITNKKINWK